MRLLKILLIIFSIIILGSVLYACWFEFYRAGVVRTSIYLYVYFGFALISVILNILYHIKSFHYYRQKENRNLDKKLPKLFWIGTMCFSAFIMYIGFNTLYKIISYGSQFGYSIGDIFIILLFIIPSFLGFLEVSILKKRIKRLKTEHDVKDEINSIGNSIINK